MTQEWQPTPHEFSSGQEAYIRYLSGVAILNEPASPVASGLHGRELTAENKPVIAAHAVSLMYNGARRMISLSNPPDTRAMPMAEHQFNLALPTMHSIVDTVYEKHRERISAVNPGFSLLRPAPMLEEATYHHLCHSRLGKLRVSALLDGILAAEYFGEDAEQRSLADIYRGDPATG